MMDGGATVADAAGGWRRWRLRIARRIRQWRGLEPRTRVQIRCEQEPHGGWWICPHVLQPSDVVYSFDLGGDLGLERVLLRNYAARVYVFDPHPDAADRAEREGLLDEFQLYAVRVGPENRPAEPDRGAEGARMIRLGALMRTLGHRRLDLIKLNVDTAAAAIHDLVELDVDVRQLLVRMPPVAAAEDAERVEELVSVLEGHGYRIFNISPDGRRYSFIRTDFGAT